MDDYLPPVVAEIVLRTAGFEAGTAQVRAQMAETATSVDASANKASESTEKIATSAKATADSVSRSNLKIATSARQAAAMAAEQAAAMGKSDEEIEAAAGKAAEAYTVAQAKMTQAQKASALGAAEAAAAAGKSATEQEAAYARAAVAAEVEGEKISRSQRFLGQSLNNAGIAMGGALGRPLRGFGRQIEDTEHKARSLTGTLAEVGKVVTYGGILGFIGAAYEGVKAATAYQTSLAQIAADSGQGNANAIGKAFLGTMGSSAFSATAMASSYAQVSQQLKVVEGSTLNAASAMKVMSAASDLAKGSQTDLGTSTQALAQIMQAYHLSVGQASQAADALYSTARATGSGVGEIATAMGRLHSRLGAVTPSLRDVGGLMVGAAQTGLTGSRGVLQMSSAIQHLLSGSTQVSDELRQLTGSTGLTGVNGQFIGMTATIAKLHSAFAGLAPSMQIYAANTLFGAGAGQVMLQVIDKGTAAFQKDAAQADKAGSAHAAAAAQAKTLSDQLEVVKATLEDVTVAFGQMLIPVVQKAGTILAGVVTWFDRNKAAALALAAIVTGVLGAAVAVFVDQRLKKLATGLGELGDDLKAIGPKFMAWASSLAATEPKITGVGAATGQTAEKVAADTSTMDASITKFGSTVAEQATSVEMSLERIGAAFPTLESMVGANVAEINDQMNGLAENVAVNDAKIVAANREAGASFGGAGAGVGASVGAGAGGELEGALGGGLLARLAGGAGKLGRIGGPLAAMLLAGEAYSKMQGPQSPTGSGLASLLGPVPKYSFETPSGGGGGGDQFTNAVGSTLSGIPLVGGVLGWLMNISNNKSTVALEKFQQSLQGVADPAKLSTDRLEAFYSQAMKIEQLPDITARQRTGLQKLAAVLNTAAGGALKHVASGSQVMIEGQLRAAADGRSAAPTGISLGQQQSADQMIRNLQFGAQGTTLGPLEQLLGAQRNLNNARPQIRSALLAGRPIGGIVQGAETGKGEQQYHQEIVRLQQAGMTTLVNRLEAAHKQALDSLVKQLVGQQALQDAATLTLESTRISGQTKAAQDAAAAQVTVLKDQQTIAQNAATTQVAVIKDQQTLASQAMQAAAKNISDSASVMAARMSAAATAITDASTVQAARSSMNVQAMSDATKVQTDILGERMLYGYQLVAQRLQVEQDTVKEGFDKQIALQQINVDEIKQHWDGTIAAEQIVVARVQQHEDQLVAIAQQKETMTQMHADTLLGVAQQREAMVQMHSDMMVGAAQQTADTVQLAADLRTAIAQNAVTLSQSATPAQKQQAQNMLMLAQAQSGVQTSTAQQAFTSVQSATSLANQQAAGAFQKVQQSTNLANQRAAGIYQKAQDKASIEMAKVNRTLTADQGRAQIEEAKSQAKLQALNNTMNKVVQKLQDQIDLATAGGGRRIRSDATSLAYTGLGSAGRGGGGNIVMNLGPPATSVGIAAEESTMERRHARGQGLTINGGVHISGAGKDSHQIVNDMYVTFRSLSTSPG